VSFFEIVSPDTNLNFIGKWKLCALLSVGFLIASGVGYVVNDGLKFGIDFAGGTEIQVRFLEEGVAEEGVIRQAVSEAGVDDASVVRYGGEDSHQFLIRFRGEEEHENLGLVKGIMTRLRDNIGPVEEDRVDFVGPRVGEELKSDGIQALLIAGILILIYVAFRFSTRFAPGAIVALLHDVLITAGIFVICGWEFNLGVLAALLAIVGYSLNDTIIVYDRIRENLETHTTVDLPAVLNLSVNQTLSRTLLTSGTTLLAVLSLLLVGGEVIRPFATAMTIGVLIGTYSSIYIASPTLRLLEHWAGSKERKKG